MKKNRLRKKLSQLKGFESPKVELEQYSTPPALASDICFTVHMQGCENVVDLGTGNGILAIGSALLGMNVTAVEIDKDALRIARENAETSDASIDFVRKDVEQFNQKGFDAVIMNPPFNIQSDEGLTFWEKALEISDAVYGLAGKGFRPRLEKLCSKYNHEIKACEEYKIGLPSSFHFHSEESRATPVDLYITSRKKN